MPTFSETSETSDNSGFTVYAFLPCTPPAMHTSCHACPPAMQAQWDTCPLPCTPLPCVSPTCPHHIFSPAVHAPPPPPHLKHNFPKVRLRVVQKCLIISHLLVQLPHELLLKKSDHWLSCNVWKKMSTSYSVCSAWELSFGDFSITFEKSFQWIYLSFFLLIETQSNHNIDSKQRIQNNFPLTLIESELSKKVQFFLSFCKTRNSLATMYV